jgi:hypothetical protein
MVIITNSRKNLAVVAMLAAAAACVHPVLGATTLATSSDVGRAWRTGGVTVKPNVPVSGQPFKSAVSFTVPRKTANVWGAQVGTNPKMPLGKGDALTATFYIRSTNPASGGKVTFAVEGGPKFDRLAWRDLKLSNKWQKVSIPITSKGAYDAGKWQTTFKMGAMPQTVQVANFRLIKK